jgi:hypothetical protein
MTEPSRKFQHAEDLPGTVPIFPLSGALLLPRARLPLHIFEPRYLTMVDAALGGHRLIGMIQPRPAPETVQRPDLYPVGCLGKITSFSETEDGRYFITLTGVCRFRPERELDTITPYRQIVADYADFEADLAPAEDENAVDRHHLAEALKDYLTKQNLDADWETIEHAPCETLVNSLAVICPFEPPEKQALLEAPTLAERGRALIALIEMASAEEDDDEDGGGHTLN